MKNVLYCPLTLLAKNNNEVCMAMDAGEMTRICLWCSLCLLCVQLSERSVEARLIRRVVSPGAWVAGAGQIAGRVVRNGASRHGGMEGQTVEARQERSTASGHSTCTARTYVHQPSLRRRAEEPCFNRQGEIGG